MMMYWLYGLNGGLVMVVLEVAVDYAHDDVADDSVADDDDVPNALE